MADKKTTTYDSFSYNSFVKKKDREISVPFLPKGYENNISKYIKANVKSRYRNEVFERVLKFSQPELKKYCKKCGILYSGRL